jgi:hypothetical protein
LLLRQNKKQTPEQCQPTQTKIAQKTAQDFTNRR